MRRRWGIAYPLLAASYPVVALAAANGGELVTPHDLVLPLAIAATAALAAWLLCGLAIRDHHRRAFLAFLLVVVFSSYGYVGDLLPVRARAAGMAGVGTTLFIVGAAWLVRRSRVSFAAVSLYLTLVFQLLLVWAGGKVLWRWWRNGTDIPLPALAAGSLPPVGAHISRPHFFFIVLDKYTGHHSLAANYGFDNGPFEEMLEQRGFAVPRSAKANYVHTFLALAAILNWQYLDEVAARLGHDNPDWSRAYPLIEQNRTARLLRDLGYRFVFLPTALPATHENRYADLQVPEPGELPREFEAVWLRGTLLLPILDLLCPAIGCAAGGLPYVPESAASLDHKFATLPALARSEQPVFVFAHLTVPHEPYIYDADCRHRRPYWPKTDTGPDSEVVKAAYVAQVRCVNRKVQDLVDAIDRESSRPAVILLQSDHGHGRLGRDQPPLSAAEPGKIAERLDIFAAYRLPGAPPGTIADSVGPVNAMRAIMRLYYRLDLPPLAEASYWSSADRPYRFTRIQSDLGSASSPGGAGSVDRSGL